MPVDPAVEAVWVTANDKLHAPFTLAALRAGKHVLVEKPMATSVAEAEAMAHAARAGGKVLRVGHHQRFVPVYARLRDELAAGRIGALRYARFQFFYGHFDEDAARRPSRGSLAGSGGCWVLKELGSHLFDLLRFCTGEEARVAGALLATQRYSVETDDAASVLVLLSSGAIGVIDVSAAAHGWTDSVELFGSAGWVRGDGIWMGNGQLGWSDGTVDRFSLDERLTPYFDLLADFVGAVAGQGGGRAATGEDGTAVLTFVEQALDLHRRAAG
jgi:predicted dehydrogenase